MVGLAMGLDAVEIGKRLKLSRRSIDSSIASLKAKAGNPRLTLRGLIVRAAQDEILDEILGWRLGPTGHLVQSVQAATRTSLNLPPKSSRRVLAKSG